MQAYLAPSRIERIESSGESGVLISICPQLLHLNPLSVNSEHEIDFLCLGEIRSSRNAVAGGGLDKQ